MRDYAGNYRVKPQTHVATGRTRGRMVSHPLRTLFWKTAGGMVVVAMCTGVMASFWLGHQIQNSLLSIATMQQSTHQQKTMQTKLMQERDGLLSTERMIARAAVQHGLYQADPKQQKRFRD